MPPELTFLIAAVVVILAGARLARDGDAIADRTGLGEAWVGAILVAGATSLPEIATDVSAVRQGDTNLAIGDLFGSSMANMLILGVADLVTRQTSLMAEAAISQAMVGALAIALTAVAAAGVLAGGDLALFGIGWAPATIFVGYVLGMRLLHVTRAGQRTDSTTARPMDGANANGSGASSKGVRRPAIGFAMAAIAVLAAAPFLASSASTLAEEWGISSGFFGTVFLAAATSLPEVAVVWTALHAGAYTLAVGNLLGSNCFNMLVLIVLDVADGSSSLLAGSAPGVIVGAVFSILLMSQVLLDLLNRSEGRLWWVEPGPGLIVITYAAGLFLTYRAMH